MVKLLLALDKVPTPHDEADALAVAICHLHQAGRGAFVAAGAWEKRKPGVPKSCRHYKPPVRAGRP